VRLDSVLPDRSGSRAVLIGVAEYRELEALPSVGANLTQLSALFQDPSRWGLPASNCLGLRNPSSSEVVCDALEAAAAEVTDTLVFYYAGHGLIDADATDEELYLALPDSRPNSAYRTGLPYSWVRRELLKAKKARRRVVILDCCYSGRALTQRMGTQGEDTIRRLLDIDGTCVLTATARTRTALAPPDEALTAFTGELVEALTTGIPDGPELLDVDTLYQYVWQRLLAKERPRPQKAQTGFAGRIALSRNPAHRAFLLHEVDRVEAERDQAIARVAELEAGLASQQIGLIDQLRAEVNDARKEAERAGLDARGKTNEVRRLGAERDNLTAQLEIGLKDRARLESDVDTLRGQLLSAREDMSAARAEARRLRDDADSKLAAALQMRDDSAEARVTADRLRREADAALSEIARERISLRREKDRLEALAKEPEAAARRVQARTRSARPKFRLAPSRLLAGNASPSLQTRPRIRSLVWIVLLIFAAMNAMYVLIAWKGLFRS
jgi:uncharacterized caspase-like protein